MRPTPLLFIGIKGTVLALNRATGEEVWRTHLKASDFIHVVLDNGELYAATKGELFAVDPASGQVRWQNSLAGLGRGLVSIASSSSGITVVQEKRQRDQAAASATVIAAGAAG